jgi:hypothetical protein
MGLFPIGKRANTPSQNLADAVLNVTWWSRIPVTVPSRMREYNVSFRNSDENTYIHRQHLVGVMRPTMSAKEADVVELGKN